MPVTATRSKLQAELRAAKLLNVPNTLTVSRLILALVLFAFLSARQMIVSLVLFVIAASTDWLDGYLARKRGETTRLGRILDPFVDKVIVLGSFIFLLPIDGSGIAAWMVTLVLARELLVTSLRGYFEQQGVAFPADWAGKCKMVMQCLCIGGVLLYLSVASGQLPASPAWQLALGRLSTALIWLMVLVTAWSGVSYCLRAVRLANSSESR